jgi:acetyl esterase
MRSVLAMLCLSMLMSAVVWAQTPAPELQPETQVYRQLEGRALKLYLFAPASAKTRAAVLLLHGGGWTVGEPSWSFVQARRLAQAGLLAIAVEYRLADDTHTPQDALSDTCAAFHWVRQHAQQFGVHAKRIGGFGESAGGQLLALAATAGCGNKEGQYANGGPDALALWSPALDVAQDSWFIKQSKSPQLAAANSPLANLHTAIAPLIIVSGEADVITPPGGIRQFCDKAKNLGGRCDLNMYAGVGHLLTRKLDDQVSSYDPDPALVEAGQAGIDQFFGRLWPGK